MKQQRTKSLYLGTIAVALLSALSIVGCASLRDANTAELAPRSLADVTHASVTAAKAGRSPSVALVLGGGGLRGFAHLGVLHALEEAGSGFRKHRHLMNAPKRLINRMYLASA